MPTPVYVRGTIVGQIDAGVFIKNVRGRIHMLRQPPAWALDAETYETQIRPTCHKIIIEDIDTKIKYSTTLERFEDLKKTLNRGHGKQYFMFLDFWAKEYPNQKALIK